MSHKKNLNQVKISKELRDIIHGYIMSDGFVTERGALTVDHSRKQEKFVEWLYEKLRNLRTENPILKRVIIHSVTRNQSSTCSFQTRSLLGGFHKMWYRPYTNAQGVRHFKKHLPKSIHGFFNSTFVTLWFAGDGTKILTHRAAKFEVTAWTPEERNTLKKLFRQKFGFDVRIHKAGFSKTGTQQWTLNILAADYNDFRNLITKIDLIENCFPHKLHPKQ